MTQFWFLVSICNLWPRKSWKPKPPEIKREPLKGRGFPEQAFSLKGWNYCSRVIYSAKVFSLVQHLQSSAIIQEQSSLLLIQGIAGEYTECLHMLFTQWNHPECATNVCKYICYCWHNPQAPNECGYSRTLWLLHQLLLFFQLWTVPAHIFLETMNDERWEWFNL